MQFIEKLEHALSPAGIAEMQAAMSRATAPARVGMVVGKRYIRYTYNKDKSIASATYVGTFIRNYRMGSGDGMTYHVEFKDDEGKIHVFGEEMWGYVDDVPATYSETHE